MANLDHRHGAGIASYCSDRTHTIGIVWDSFWSCFGPTRYNCSDHTSTIGIVWEGDQHLGTKLFVRQLRNGQWGCFEHCITHLGTNVKPPSKSRVSKETVSCVRCVLLHRGLAFAQETSTGTYVISRLQTLILRGHMSASSPTVV